MFFKQELIMDNGFILLMAFTLAVGVFSAWRGLAQEKRESEEKSSKK
jgi:hypothetical protein